MQATWTIYPILTCRLKLDKGTFTYRNFYGEKIMAPVYAWLVKGTADAFLVDAGCSVAEASQLSHVFEGEERSPIESSLQKMGISISDIETIVLTHMHIDHFANARKFPRAKVVVQEEELRFARDPHPVFSRSYNPVWYEDLEFDTVEGDTEIFPGVDLISTPGHSPGTQSVSIATDQGKVVIAGCCSVDDNFRDEGDIVPGIHSDIFKAYDSMVKIRSLGGTLIPPHTERYVNVDSIP